MSSTMRSLDQRNGTPPIAYASIDSYMNRAIDALGSVYDRKLRGRGYVVQLNALPTPMLKQIGYEPARDLVREAADAFFSQQTVSGLVRLGDYGSAPYYGALFTGDTSHLDLLKLMSGFMFWLGDIPAKPGEKSYAEKCKLWADGIVRHNDTDSNYSDPTKYGHRVRPNDWKMFNYVHTGLLDPTIAPNPANWTMVFEEKAKGKPDSWWTISTYYGLLLQGFWAISTITGDNKYRDIGLETVAGQWRDRLVKERYLISSHNTVQGPLSSGTKPPDYKHYFDSDSEHWAVALFRAYRDGAGAPVASMTPDLDDYPQGVEKDFASFDAARKNFEDTIKLGGPGYTFAGRLLQTLYLQQVDIRKVKVGPFLSGSPQEQVLAMAVLFTLDWIQCSWDAKRALFRNEVYFDGTPASDRIYDEGIPNTLYLLMFAFRFTGDWFYLALFDRFWESLWSTVRQIGSFTFLATELPNGGWGDIDNVKRRQEDYLDVIVDAAFSAETLGWQATHGQRYFNYADTLAGWVSQICDDAYLQNNYNGVFGQALVKLASRSTLRRTQFRGDPAKSYLQIRFLMGAGNQSDWVDMPVKVAGKSQEIVVYIGPGYDAVEAVVPGQPNSNTPIDPSPGAITNLP